jgi:aldehyde dehydrogenase (NAD+)
MTGETRLLIDGKFTLPLSGKTYDNINPATEEVLGQAADAQHEDIELAIGAARRAFDESDWATNPKLRQRCLQQLQAAIEREREELRAELVAEVGCPVFTTYGPQLDMPLEDSLLWPAAAIDTFPFERDLPENEKFGMKAWRRVYKEPVGVVGAIAPWNFPFEILLGKLGAPLATGNTVVVKVAPDTPWSSARIGRLIAEHTDIPPGVVNMITSSSPGAGEQLVTDPRVDMISFTGSTAVGRRIMEKGAPTLKRLFLELGGKSCNIMLEDSDFEASLPMAGMICMHAGQGCAMPTRLMLPRSRYDEGIAMVKAAFEGVTYGDPTSDANIQGPQVNAKQRERVLGYIQKGVEEGAALLVGGKRPAHLDKGFYVEPTLFGDVDNSMTIAQEEIFGPVLVVIPFDDDADAIRIANDSPYGLSGNVTSGSEERALNMAKRIRTGTVAVNGGMWYAADTPFGGYKASGVGRQNGIEGLEQYLETKTIAGSLPS